MSYRPICDTWILARPKVKYYGAFPSGFLHRARALMGVGSDGALLHVCSGKIREYPYRGFGKNDKTLDLDPACEPEYLRDAREPFPFRCLDGDHEMGCVRGAGNTFGSTLLLHHYWDGVLIDRPYTLEDADHYAPGRAVLPSANLLVKNGIAVIPIGGKVGILDYVWPQPPKNATEVAVITVAMGRNNRARYFTVFERLS